MQENSHNSTSTTLPPTMGGSNTAQADQELQRQQSLRVTAGSTATAQRSATPLAPFRSNRGMESGETEAKREEEACPAGRKSSTTKRRGSETRMHAGMAEEDGDRTRRKPGNRTSLALRRQIRQDQVEAQSATM